MTQTPKSLYILGCGEVLNAITDDFASYSINQHEVKLHVFEDVSLISEQADDILSQWPPAEFDCFIAVDSHALNYARLELYGRARLRGFRMRSLIHRSAVISPSAQIADNVWIGPSVLLGADCKIGSNTMIGAGSQMDPKVVTAAHVWLGASCKVGRNSKIASYSVIGSNVILRSDTEIGKHTLINQTGPWGGHWAAGRFLEAESRQVAQIVGPGYTFDKKLAV